MATTRPLGCAHGDTGAAVGTASAGAAAARAHTAKAMGMSVAATRVNTSSLQIVQYAQLRTIHDARYAIHGQAGGRAADVRERLADRAVERLGRRVVAAGRAAHPSGGMDSGHPGAVLGAGCRRPQTAARGRRAGRSRRPGRRAGGPSWTAWRLRGACRWSRGSPRGT